MNRREQDELHVLVDQAWEFRQRGSGYFIDAAAAIVDWHERRFLRARERRDEDFARLVRLLEQTDADARRRAA